MSDKGLLPKWQHRYEEPAKNWDSIARRYVEHDTLPQETFAVWPFAVGVDLGSPDGDKTAYWPPANDNAARKGDWMQTFTGRQFWPLDPRASEMFIEDIAHALSMQCRFAGHCMRFYSVAEHSVHLARYVSPANAMWALLHDASEAYLVDVPRPVKPFLAGYKPAEAAVMAEVCMRFDLPPEMPPEVHEADSRIIADERANMAPGVADWASGYDNPLGIEPQCWPPGVAEIYFLDTFRKLSAENTRAAA